MKSTEVTNQLNLLRMIFYGRKAGKNMGAVVSSSLQKRSALRDAYVKSLSAPETSELYTNFAKAGRYISNDILEAMNTNISKIKRQGDIFEVNGVQFTAAQIPPIDGSRLPEIKAKDNVIDFGRRQYFKYVSPDGAEHKLYTNDKGINNIYSEHLRGEPYDEALQKYASFWRYLMGKDQVYMGLYYEREEVHQYLREAGIENGFFTVKMGDRESVLYYSASRLTPSIESKERYDRRYESMTVPQSYGLFSGYEPGSVFRLNGKEYVLSEEHTLDIPYGEDIFCLEYPRNYVCGRKID